MKKYKVYCYKEYIRNYISINLYYKFNKGILYDCGENDEYIEIYDNDNNILRFDKDSIFAKEKYNDYFMTICELRNNKLRKVGSCL